MTEAMQLVLVIVFSVAFCALTFTLVIMTIQMLKEWRNDRHE